jgi:Xaa-Pro dipeptidase
MGERFPEFEKAEFERRWERARSLMQDAGLDALFVTSESNFRYLSGHVTPFWVSKSRPLFFILPRGGRPVLLVTRNQVTAARATSWVEDVRSWEGFVTEGVDLTVETLGELGLTRGRIGAELGFEQRLGLPVQDFLALERRLPDATFVDAANVFWEARLIKSPAEIEYLRRSARIASQAYREVFEVVRAGITEREIFASYAASTIRQGAERPGYVPVTSGPGNYDRIATSPSARALQKEDLLWMDGGAVYRGYWSDFARMAAVGSATDLQKRYYRAACATMNKCIRAVRPGGTMASLVQIALTEFENAGIVLNAHSRIGHGIGLDITEPPSINAAETVRIAPGMALTMEPTASAEFGFFQLEENFVVTPEGVELFTEPAPEELPIVPA